MPGYSDYKTKSKGVSYDKRFNVGKNSTLDVGFKKRKIKI
jgi:hypothetical protein